MLLLKDRSLPRIPEQCRNAAGASGDMLPWAKKEGGASSSICGCPPPLRSASSLFRYPACISWWAGCVDFHETVPGLRERTFHDSPWSRSCWRLFSQETPGDQSDLTATSEAQTRARAFGTYMLGCCGWGNRTPHSFGGDSEGDFLYTNTASRAVHGQLTLTI